MKITKSTIHAIQKKEIKLKDIPNPKTVCFRSTLCQLNKINLANSSQLNHCDVITILFSLTVIYFVCFDLWQHKSV